jgi:hypothetical protein
MLPGKTFDPATETSRRPTPEKFAHLKKGVEPVKKSIRLTSMADLVNINEQLLQSAELYIDNLISRVIAQLIGKYGDGFVTLEATADGKLKVEASIPAGDTVGLDAGANLIGNVKLAGAIQAITSAKIDFSTAASHTIVAGQAGKKIKISSLMLTVGGETNITLKSGTTAFTGAMDFGGTDEPRGMVDNHGYIPYELGTGEAFVIQSSAAVQVSGYVTGYIE